MEALRIKIDNLEREVERLTVENRKLREDDPGASERLDREAELQRTKNDVAEVTNRMEVLEQQLAERTSAAEDAEVRAGQAEARIAEVQRLAGGFDMEMKASEEIAGL
jgi:chromosome segregation ATPase